MRVYLFLILFHFLFLCVLVLRAQDYDLQQKLKPMMVDKKPLPSIYFPDFIAANQSERADNVLTGSKQEQMDQVCCVLVLDP